MTAVDQAITVPAGSFTGCIRIEEVHPLEEDETESKGYCPGVGLVLEGNDEGSLELITVERVQSATPVGSIPRLAVAIRSP